MYEREKDRVELIRILFRTEDDCIYTRKKLIEREKVIILKAFGNGPRKVNRVIVCFLRAKIVRPGGMVYNVCPFFYVKYVYVLYDF